MKILLVLLVINYYLKNLKNKKILVGLWVKKITCGTLIVLGY